MLIYTAVLCHSFYLCSCVMPLFRSMLLYYPTVVICAAVLYQSIYLQLYYAIVLYMQLCYTKCLSTGVLCNSFYLCICVIRKYLSAAVLYHSIYLCNCVIPQVSFMQLCSATVFIYAAVLYHSIYLCSCVMPQYISIQLCYTTVFICSCVMP